MAHSARGPRQADIGIKNGYISGIGKAGNPDVMEGVTPGMVRGPRVPGPGSVPRAWTDELAVKAPRNQDTGPELETC